ncbi:MAG TPA: hypothetical protein PKI03_29890, partial [Pseudomonadota bacterium]|nr:hypothetical protein [Pseudomonadota bacterium]
SGPEPFELELPSEYESESVLVLPIDVDLFGALAGGPLSGSDSASIVGALRLELTEDRQVFIRTADAALTLRPQLMPVIDRVTPTALFLGDDVVIQGSGFLLDGEGQMVLTLVGTFVRQVDPGDRSSLPQSQASLYPRIEHTLVPVSRTEARLPLRAKTLGIQPGTLYAQATLENRQITGAKLATPTTSQTLSLLRTQLTGLDTKVVRRGQRIGASGAGFLPLDLTGDTATAVHLSGTFTLKSDGTVVPTDLTLITDVTDSHRLVFVPHPTVDGSGKLTGLGSRAGRFIGTIEPEVLSGAIVQHGVPLPCSPLCVVDVGSPLQVLYLKFLTNFTEGLRRFGLRNIEIELREQVLAVVRRTYREWNVDVRDSLPSDFDEFTTIEIGGPDPNNAGLFGLDNSDALDSGNLRLNDYIGGFNAAADRKGVYGFGGVFIEPFLSLSPRAPKPLPIASPLFDEVFLAFVPEYGGKPASRSELMGGERQATLQEAVRVLGALIGGTVAHEFGHSLGMAIVPGGGSHNLADLDRELMDAGPFRPFEERAELGDYQLRPAGFSDTHRSYLNQILPHD